MSDGIKIRISMSEFCRDRSGFDAYKRFNTTSRELNVIEIKNLFYFTNILLGIEFLKKKKVI